jgi:hypothetical protein
MAPSFQGFRGVFSASFTLMAHEAARHNFGREVRPDAPEPATRNVGHLANGPS